MEYKKLLAALGLGDDASLEDALSAIKALQDDKGKEDGDDEKKEAKASDDESDDDEKKKDEKTSDDESDEGDKDLSALTPKLRGMFLAMQSNVAKLTKKLAAVESKQTKSEVDQLIADNTDKIPLHMEPFLKKQPIETVQEFLKHAISTPRPKVQPKDETKGTEEVKLTKEEKELARLSGIKEDAQLKFKKERVAKERARQVQAD